MRFRRSRRCSQEDVDLDMVPIMNMFLVLIPFLLMSASFFHLRAISTSVPVLSESEAAEQSQKKIKVTVIVELKEESLQLSAVCDELDDSSLQGMSKVISKTRDDAYPLESLSENLQRIKAAYPTSDTLVIIPDGDVVYDTIIQTMDVARNMSEDPLFPNVVISGKVG